MESRGIVSKRSFSTREQLEEREFSNDDKADEIEELPPTKKLHTTPLSSFFAKPQSSKLKQVKDSPSSTCTSVQTQLTISNKSPLPPLTDTNTTVVKNFINLSQSLNVVYYPQFLSSKDSRIILKSLKEQLEPYFERSPNIIKLGGREIPIPRRQTAFGDTGLKYSFSGISLPSNTWIPLIEDLKKCVEKASGESFNFVLVNSYADGSKYIGEHRDDERELHPSSSIASLSFGAERDFVFRHGQSRGKAATRKDITPIKICLSSGSLLLMKPPTNSVWYHSLPVRKGVANLRINLTFRRMIT